MLHSIYYKRTKPFFVPLFVDVRSEVKPASTFIFKINISRCKYHIAFYKLQSLREKKITDFLSVATA